MTTDNTDSVTDEVAKDRAIGVLLELDTYDNLTDGEVRALIAHKEKMAKFDTQIQVSRENATALYENHVATVAACCEATNAVLESIINSTTNYQGVAPTAVTNLLTAMEEV